jgi:putative endopeptidase
LQKPEEKRSIGAVNMFAGEMMGKVFVSKMFPPESKVEMVTMVQETLDVMRESITASDWLTDATKVRETCSHAPRTAC